MHDQRSMVLNIPSVLKERLLIHLGLNSLRAKVCPRNAIHAGVQLIRAWPFASVPFKLETDYQ